MSAPPPRMRVLWSQRHRPACKREIDNRSTSKVSRAFFIVGSKGHLCLRSVGCTCFSPRAPPTEKVYADLPPGVDDQLVEPAKVADCQRAADIGRPPARVESNGETSATPEIHIPASRAHPQL